jgi:hypothetical protein
VRYRHQALVEGGGRVRVERGATPGMPSAFDGRVDRVGGRKGHRTLYDLAARLYQTSCRLSCIRSGGSGLSYVSLLQAQVVGQESNLRLVMDTVTQQYVGRHISRSRQGMCAIGIYTWVWLRNGNGVERPVVSMIHLVIIALKRSDDR